MQQLRSTDSDQVKGLIAGRGTPQVPRSNYEGAGRVTDVVGSAWMFRHVRPSAGTAVLPTPDSKTAMAVP